MIKSTDCTAIFEIAPEPLAWNVPGAECPRTDLKTATLDSCERMGGEKVGDSRSKV